MCFEKKDIFPMDIFICKIYFQKRFWKIYFLKNICFNIFLKRIFDTNICLAYDEKTHAAEWLYKEDSYPSFELSL